MIPSAQRHLHEMTSVVVSSGKVATIGMGMGLDRLVMMLTRASMVKV